MSSLSILNLQLLCLFVQDLFSVDVSVISMDCQMINLVVAVSIDHENY